MLKPLLGCVALAAALSDAAMHPSGTQLAFAPALALRGGPSSSISLSGGNREGVVVGGSLLQRRDARMQPLKMAVYNEEVDPKAVQEIKQLTVPKMDPATLRAWIVKWPSGTSKDGFGLPKLMLPVSHETNDKGVKLVFKGSADPWMQIELELDTVRVYRCSALSTSALSVSALKEREESKICDKLAEDMAKLGALSEKEIPVIKPEEPEEEEKAEEGEEKAEGDAPAAADGGDEPPATAA